MAKTRKSDNNIMTYKDNFWSKLRVERGIRISEIAQYMGMSNAAIGGYFTGQFLPNDDVIKALCELFDVEYGKGSCEFQKAHREWKADQTREVQLRATPTPKAPEVKKQPTVSSGSSDKTRLANRVGGILYGKIPYAVFVEVTDKIKGGEDPIKCLYGKVDFDTFNEVVSVLGK